MDAKLVDEMKCPICLDIPTKEIFQCINGHSLCNFCLERVSACPQCRTEFGATRIRNRSLEAILDVMMFNCTYSSNGCDAKLKRQDMRSHTANCVHSGTQINFCELIGFQCGYLTRYNVIKEAITHFEESHRISKTNALEFGIKYQFRLPLVSKKMRLWNPRLIEISGISLLLFGFSRDGKSFSLICVQLEALPKNAIFDALRVEFAIKSLDPNKAPDIIVSTQPAHMKHIAISLKYPHISFPIDLLSKHYIKADLLSVSCLITRRDLAHTERRSKECVVCTIRGDAFDIHGTEQKCQIDEESSDDEDGLSRLARLRQELEKTRLK